MAFLSNKSVNYLNLHVALVNMLDQSFMVFIPIYLYTQGFSIPAVLGLLALFIGLRMPMRFVAFPAIRRFGLKTAVMIGAAGYGLTFPVLSQVTHNGGWLWLYIVMYTIFNSMHWLAFHTLYSLSGEHEKRGRQVAAAQAITATLMAIAPLLGAADIAQAGFTHYFAFAFVVIALMLIALARCHNIPVPPMQWGEGRKLMFGLGTKIHLMESSAQYPMNICWLFAVYLYVGKILTLGGIIAFGVVVQVLYQLLLGAWVDRGRGTLIVHISEVLGVVVAFGRAFLPLSIPNILGLEATMAAGSVHHMAVLPTAMYNAGKQSPHPLWYWLFAEMAWDAGTVIGAGGAALLLLAGVELRHVILMALPFIGILWWLLHDYFKRHAYVPAI